MRLATKLLRGDPSRVTRFHTERGALMPLKAWLEMPRAVAVRLRGDALREPWMVPSAVSFLNDVAKPEWSVLELGAGASTIWWSTRCSHVTSLEDDPEWLEGVRDSLGATRQTNVSLVLARRNELRTIVETDSDSYDIAVIDSNETVRGDRLSLVNAAIPLVRPGGYLVLDDSDRPEYAPLPLVLREWKMWRFVGFKSRPLMACETSVFQSPADFQGIA